MILLKMLLSIVVLHVLWLGSVLSLHSPSQVISPRMILRTPPLGHCPHSCFSAKSMPTVSPITTARAVHLASHSLTSLARGIGGRWQLAGRVFAATRGRPSLSSATQQPHRGIYRARRGRLQHSCHPHPVSLRPLEAVSESSSRSWRSHTEQSSSAFRSQRIVVAAVDSMLRTDLADLEPQEDAPKRVLWCKPMS